MFTVASTLFLQLFTTATFSGQAPPTPGPPARQEIALNADYLLSFQPPGGWTVEPSSDGAEWTSGHSINDANVNLDWYKPYRDRTYHDFRARIREEARGAKRIGKDVRARYFTIDGLSCAEVRYRDPRLHRVNVIIFIGVPATKEFGELFLVFFDGPDSRGGSAHMAEYLDMVRTMRVEHDDE
jgi:hypothetical protein